MGSGRNKKAAAVGRPAKVGQKTSYQKPIPGMVRIDAKLKVHPRIKDELKATARERRWSLSKLIAYHVIHALRIVPEEALTPRKEKGANRRRR